MSDSISRMRSCGTWLTTPAVASAGFGSLTNLTRRVVVGLTFNRIVSSSLICGVTFMMKPTGTVTGVVLVAVTAFEFRFPAARLTWTLKYTTLSTTRNRAVWLFKTDSFGLESTRTFPNDSSSCRTPEILAPTAPMVKMFWNDGALGRAPGGCAVTPGGNGGLVETLPPDT